MSVAVHRQNGAVRLPAIRKQEQGLENTNVGIDEQQLLQSAVGFVRPAGEYHLQRAGIDTSDEKACVQGGQYSRAELIGRQGRVVRRLPADVVE